MLESMCLDQGTEVHGKGKPRLQINTWPAADASLVTSEAMEAMTSATPVTTSVTTMGTSLGPFVAATMAGMPMPPEAQQAPTVVTFSQPSVSLSELLHHFPDLPSFILHPQFPEFSRVWVEFQRQIALAKDPQYRPAVQDWLRSAVSHLAQPLWQLQSTLNGPLYEDCEASSRFMLSAFRRLKERIEVMQQLFQILENGRQWFGQEPRIAVTPLLKAITKARQDVGLTGSTSTPAMTGLAHAPVPMQQPVFPSSSSSSSSFSSTASSAYSPTDLTSTPLPWSQTPSIKTEEEDAGSFPEDGNLTYEPPSFYWSQQGHDTTLKKEHDSQGVPTFPHWTTWSNQPTSLPFQTSFFAPSTDTMTVPMTTMAAMHPTPGGHEQPLLSTPAPDFQHCMCPPILNGAIHQGPPLMPQHTQERQPCHRPSESCYTSTMPDCVHPTALIQPTATWSVPVTPSEHPRQASYFWSCPASPGHDVSDKDDEGAEEETEEDDDEEVEVDDDKDEDYQASTASEAEDEDREEAAAREVKQEIEGEAVVSPTSTTPVSVPPKRALLARPSRQHRQYTRRTATSYDAQTTHYLKSVFFNIYSKRDKLTKEQRREVQQHTGLKPRNITYWFSNHKRRFQTSLLVFKQTVRESSGRVKTYDDFLRWRRMRGLPDEVMEVEVQSGHKGPTHP